MRSANLYFSAIHLFIVLFVLALGMFFQLIPFLPAFRLHLAELLVESPKLFLALGVVFTTFGILLLIGFYLLNKKKFLTIKMQASKTLIEEAVIRDYLTTYWKEVFPFHLVEFDLAFHFPQKLEVIAKFPEMEEGEKEKLFNRIQNELGVLLARKLGYEKEFFLTMSD